MDGRRIVSLQQALMAMIAAFGLGAHSGALAAPGATELVSAGKFSPGPIPSNDASFSGSISRDGRFIVFISRSTDLVPGDTNDRNDVFVTERATGVTERISVDSNGNQANGDSDGAVISADGRFVVFTSSATNLVSSDTNNADDVFVHDRVTRKTTRVSVSSTEVQGNDGSDIGDISADGRYVAFTSAATNLVPGDTNGALDVFVRDRVNGTTARVSVASNGAQGNNFFNDESVGPVGSYGASISADGRYVAFTSTSSNLVPGDTNNFPDSFVHNRVTGVTERVSVDSNGNQANGAFGVQTDPPSAGSISTQISASGRYVVFQSNASNLVPGDTNDLIDVFVHDRVTQKTIRASLDKNGAELVDNSGDEEGTQSAYISGDGRYVTFTTHAPLAETGDFFQVFVRDVAQGTTTMVSTNAHGARGEDYSFGGVISDDGRFAVFASVARNLVAGAAGGIFLKDRQAGAVTLVPIARVPSASAAGPSYVGPHAISADGRYVAFWSGAANFVSGDTNDVSDVFVLDRQTGSIERVSADSSGHQADQASDEASISSDGRYVAFSSFATNLGASAQGFQTLPRRVYVRDRATGKTELISRTSQGTPGTNFDFPQISSDGRFVVFDSTDSILHPGNTGEFHVFLRDLRAGTTTEITTGALPSISALGGYITFTSQRGTSVRDMRAGITTTISATGGRAQISGNGRFVAFLDRAPNQGIWSVFVYDTLRHLKMPASVDSNGEPANGTSGVPVISRDGRYVAFDSEASNLVSNDINNAVDTFVHDMQTGATIRASVASNGAEGVHNIVDLLTAPYDHVPAISDNGQFVAFTSRASNLVPGDLNGKDDVFLHEAGVEPTIIRVNAGGPNYTDSAGKLWSADHGFNTGGATTFNENIANTLDDPLYRDERWDPAEAPDLQYTFAVANGTYLVRLHFAENYHANLAAGRRVFDVDMNGVTLPNIDVFAEAGGHAALVKSALVPVANGQLRILFRHRVQNPIIDALELIEQGH